MLDPKTLFNFIYDRVNGQIGYTSPEKKPNTACGFLPLDSSTGTKIVSLLDEKSLVSLLKTCHEARFLAAYEITQRFIAERYDVLYNSVLVSERKNLRIVAQKINWDKPSILPAVSSDTVNKIAKSAVVILQFINLGDANEPMNEFLRDVQSLQNDNPDKVAAALETLATLLETSCKKGSSVALYLSILADVIPFLILILQNHQDINIQNNVIIIFDIFFSEYHFNVENNVVEEIIGITLIILKRFNKEFYNNSEETDSKYSRLENILLLLTTIQKKMGALSLPLINSGCLAELNHLLQLHKKFPEDVFYSLLLYISNINWDPKLIINPEVIPDIIDYLYNLSLNKTSVKNVLAKSTLIKLTREVTYKEMIIAHPKLLKNMQLLIASDSKEIDFCLMFITKLKLGPTHLKSMEKSFIPSLEIRIKNGEQSTKNMACEILWNFLNIEKNDLKKKLHENRVISQPTNIKILLESLQKSENFTLLLDSLLVDDSDFSKQRYVSGLTFFLLVYSDLETKTKILSAGIVRKICEASKDPNPEKNGILLFLLIPLFPPTINDQDLSKSAMRRYKKELNQSLNDYWDQIPLLLQTKFDKPYMIPLSISLLIGGSILLKNEAIIASVTKNISSFIQSMSNDPISKRSADSASIEHPSVLSDINYCTCLGLVQYVYFHPESIHNLFDSEVLRSLVNLTEVLGIDRQDETYEKLKHEVVNALMVLCDKCTEEQRTIVLNLSQTYPTASVLVPFLFQRRSIEQSAISIPPLPIIPVHDDDEELLALFGEKATPKTEKGSNRRKKGRASQTAVASSKEKELPIIELPALILEQGRRKNITCCDAYVDVVDKVGLVAKMSDLVVETKTIHYHYDKRVLRWLKAIEEAVRRFADYKGTSNPCYQYAGLSSDEIHKQIIHHQVFGVIEELYKPEFKNVWYIEGEKGPSFLAYYIIVGRDGVRKQQLGIVNFGINRETGNIYHAKFDPLNPGEIPTLIMEEGGEMYEKLVALPPDLDKVSIEDKSWTLAGLYAAEKLENGCMQFTYPSSSSSGSSSFLRILPLNYQRDTPAIFPFFEGS